MNEIDNDKLTVLYPGGFKPPHIGHLSLINKFPCNLNEESVQSDFIDSLILNYFDLTDNFKNPTELFKKYKNTYVNIHEIETLNIGLFTSENPINK